MSTAKPIVLKSKVYKPWMKKKKYLKKRITTNRGMVILGQGFPKKIMFTHKYFQNTLVTSTTGTMANYLFSCNGMYDPDYTGSGHQPLYFDQMSAIYDHYCVIGSKCTMKVLNNSATNGLIACGLMINDDTAVVATGISSMSEQSTASRPRYITYNSSSPVNLTGKWSARKTFGKNPLANTELQGTSAANPTEQSYFNFYLQCVDSVSTVSVYIEVMIEYIAIWKEIKDIAAS